MVEGACDDFQVEHGRLSRERSGGTFFAPGDRAFVDCDPGFGVNGTDQLLCQDGGSWDQQPPTCIEGAYPGDQPCKAPPPRLVNGGYNRSLDGRFATYHCDDHFWLKGPGQLVCIASPYENDTWVPDPGRPQEKYLDKPECHPLTSPVPSSNLVLQECQEPKILKGSYNGDCCNPGNEVQFFCAADHYALSGVTNATCLPNGTWSGPVPVCKALRICQEPKIDRGGYYGKCCDPEDEVQFYCNGDGYALFGVKNATCLPEALGAHLYPFAKDSSRSSNGRSTVIFNRRMCTDECCPPGTAVKHVCDEGYQLVAEQILLCGVIGTWNHARSKCKNASPPSSAAAELRAEWSGRANQRTGPTTRQPTTGGAGACDDFEVEHGRLIGERWGGAFFAPGDSAFVECDPGFRVNGTDQLLCEDDGLWDQEPPTCIVKGACDDFEVEHGRLTGERSGGAFFAPGDCAFVECDPGFRVNGTDQVLCEDDGSWDQQPPTCMAQEACDDFEVEHGRLSGERSGGAFFAPGDRAFVECDPGFGVNGTDQLLCQNDGSWDEKPPNCMALRACQEPKIDRGGHYGKCCDPQDEVQFYCNGDSYALFGVKNATCLPDGTWSAPMPVCKAEGACDDFEVQHGRVTGKHSSEDFFSPGDSAFVECDPGFGVNGTDQLLCQDDGSWDQQPPTCIAEGACDNFEVKHGRVTGKRSGGDFFSPGDSAFVECDPGFGVNGADQLLCQDDGSWDQQPPTCMAFRDCQEPNIDWGSYDGDCCAPKDEVEFYCDDDRYALFGVERATCIEVQELATCSPRDASGMSGSILRPPASRQNPRSSTCHFLSEGRHASFDLK
ncbi:complement receptor type 2-like [Haemaphysalis longicornis]